MRGVQGEIKSQNTNCETDLYALAISSCLKENDYVNQKRLCSNKSLHTQDLV
jgi:hypothetical protein